MCPKKKFLMTQIKKGSQNALAALLILGAVSTGDVNILRNYTIEKITQVN
jgi:hypothetical protein